MMAIVLFNLVAAGTGLPSSLLNIDPELRSCLLASYQQGGAPFNIPI